MLTEFPPIYGTQNSILFGQRYIHKQRRRHQYSSMAIKFQYNKTSLQELEKSLKMRVYALPIIKNKESALRMEVKKAKDEIIRLEQEVEQRIAAYDQMLALWGEFDTTLLRVEDVKMNVKKIAGVHSVLEEVIFTTRPFSLFNTQMVRRWFNTTQELAQVSIEH